MRLVVPSPWSPGHVGLLLFPCGPLYPPHHPSMPHPNPTPPHHHNPSIPHSPACIPKLCSITTPPLHRLTLAFAPDPTLAAATCQAVAAEAGAATADRVCVAPGAHGMLLLARPSTILALSAAPQRPSAAGPPAAPCGARVAAAATYFPQGGCDETAGQLNGMAAHPSDLLKAGGDGGKEDGEDEKGRAGGGW